MLGKWPACLPARQTISSLDPVLPLVRNWSRMKCTRIETAIHLTSISTYAHICWIIIFCLCNTSSSTIMTVSFWKIENSSIKKKEFKVQERLESREYREGRIKWHKGLTWCLALKTSPLSSLRARLTPAISFELLTSDGTFGWSLSPCLRFCRIL